MFIGYAIALGVTQQTVKTLKKKKNKPKIW